MGVDQSNVSVVVDEAVVVKWLHPPVVEPHPGVTLLEHLRAVGFDGTPSFLGAARAAGRVTAVLTAYIPGSRDGWEWYTGDVADWLDGTAAPAEPVGTARRLGAMTGRLHIALATPSEVIPDPLTTVPVEPIHAAAHRLLAAALAVTADSSGGRLGPLAGSVRAEIDVLAGVGASAAQSIHGDLHLGQILLADTASGRRWWITDFDGDPLADGPERSMPQPAAKDLAALLQSIDHVTRVAHRRRPDVALEVVDDLAAEAAGAAHGAYLAALAAADASHLLDSRLVRPFQVVQELHEYVYAARHLPHWRYVPDAALPALLARPPHP